MKTILKNSLILSIIQNSDIYWKPTLALQSDPASFVVELANSLKGYKGPDDWIASLREKDNLKEQTNV